MLKTKILDWYKIIDTFINNTAMYRLVVYVLSTYVAVAFIFSLFGMFGLVPFTPLTMFVSLATILGVCWVTNYAFMYVFKAPSNVESVYITALILFCIITPPSEGNYNAYFSLAVSASALAMATKYIVAFRKKHIFNPAALALVITALTIHQSASWWIGRGDMMVFVVLGGLLIAKKIRRWDLVLSFIASALVTILTISFFKGTDVLATFTTTFSDTAFFFFAFIMLTEPLTTPPTKKLRILYGILVGFLFAPNLHIGTLYSTPELALVLGNIFSYALSPKERFILKLKEKIRVANNTFEYVFDVVRKIQFSAGQYLEWTLPHESPDNRGNRRYFTIASSPEEETIRIGVRQFEKQSSFKSHLREMAIGSEIIASQTDGDFTLPKDRAKKIVFIAGGIGITPFVSMVRHLLLTKERRDIVLLYSNRTAVDIAYKDIFDRAVNELGIQVHYFVTDDTENTNIEGVQKGVITIDTITKILPDYSERQFYISGPNVMVTAFKSILTSVGIKNSSIKTDYFTGL